MAPKSVTIRRHDHLVSVLFGDLLSHSYNILGMKSLNILKKDLIPSLPILISRGHLTAYSPTSVIQCSSFDDHCILMVNA